MRNFHEVRAANQEKRYARLLFGKPERQPHPAKKPAKNPARVRTRFVLYRMWHHDELLYVGITNDPTRRFHWHRNNQPWWDEVTWITTTEFESNEDLEAAERTAIVAELPKYNLALRPRT